MFYRSSGIRRFSRRPRGSPAVNGSPPKGLFMATRLAVIYYSSTGHVHKLAQAVVAGAEETGADVRLRRAPELAPEEVIRSQDAWHEHATATRDTVDEATLDDLEWAEGCPFDPPRRLGNPAAQRKQFVDTAGPLGVEGKLANKPVASFTSSMN